MEGKCYRPSRLPTPFGGVVPDAGILAVGLGEWTARLVATGLITAKVTAIPKRSGKPRASGKAGPRAKTYR